MSSRATLSGGSQSTSQRRQRSRSTSRYADLDKPKKKKALSATTSLVSIPNTIKLSMLNSGLLSFEKVKLEARDENNSLAQTIPDKPIELRNFGKLCDQRRKFPVLYKLEFQTAVKVETNTCRHATRKNNLEKNQNQKCIPYDYNRVVLEKIIGVQDSDYVNASYVDSLLKPNAYIVTQGPTEETVNEFWRMVWQENVSAIIMLTKTFDFTKVMCVQYWPPNIETHESYGDININIVKEEQLANFQIRTFRLYKKEGEIITNERHILQFHYTEWHSHTCPFSNAVLEFRRRVRAVVGNIIKPNSMIGPMLVHCNDGGGRSGVYLAIDANLELAEEEDCFHVFGYLKKLRQSRKGLIENVEQYKFVYDTLEEHIVCGKTWFPVSELSERLKLKAKKDPIFKTNEYQKEYAQICRQTPRFTIGDCAGGHRADNRDKNRDVLCVPPDNFRPYLTSFQGNAFTDYINSVFVDGYTKPREYIVTEWPLKHTLGEFWSLVYDHECSAVVVLCQPPPNSQQYPPFWPQKSKMEKYGPVFTVHFVSGKHYQNIKQWEFKINKKIISLTEMMAGVKAPTKTVRLFQLTCWPMGHKVPSSTNSLVFLMNMVEQWRQRTDYGPVCVVSPDGRSRAGVYCAANACIEQVIQHGEVDIFQAVKTVRRHRPQIIDNMTEYKYCYDLVLHYVLHFLDKDLKEKKFVAFGRGKHIPLHPQNLYNEIPSEISNTGRIIVNKCIDKIDVRDKYSNFDINLSQNNFLERNSQVLDRKKKGRLYSLGGQDPIRVSHRGRLDRLKTVGTFDIGSELSVLSEVARSLNSDVFNSEIHTQIYSRSNPPSIFTSSPSTSSTRNTPETKRKNNDINILMSKLDDQNIFELSNLSIGKCSNEFKSQHSADDCIQRPILNLNKTKKSRSLSTGSQLNNEYIVQTNEKKYITIIDKQNSIENIIRTGQIHNNDRLDNIQAKTNQNRFKLSQEIFYKTRKPMLRKSRRIIRTDSEIIKDGIISTINDTRAQSEPKTYINKNNSFTSSSINSTKDLSDYDDICTNMEKIQTFNDNNNKNEINSTEQIIDGVFLNKFKRNLQREYKSDGDTLDEIGRKRNEFGKWKNQSLEHEYDISFPDIINETKNISIGINSNEKDIKLIQRVYSPDNYINCAFSDSGVKNTDTDTSHESIRCRVYSSSNVGETPTEKRRRYPIQFSGMKFYSSLIKRSCNEIETNLNNNNSNINLQNIRPSYLEINVDLKSKQCNEGTNKTSVLDKPFGKLKKVNKLLKCKKFNSSLLFDKNKTNLINKTNINNSNQKVNIPEKRATLHLSKLSLFNLKSSKNTNKKSSISSGNSKSNNELYSINENKTGFGDLSKSINELDQYKLNSPQKFISKLRGTSNSNTSHISSEQCLSPLSEEFYNKTGSTRLSAIELYEKFCSEDFNGLYKNENSNNNNNNNKEYNNLSNQHEYRLERKGLRAIGRYNKGTARLLKQKSEPRFTFCTNHNERIYYNEEEEEDYHYNDLPEEYCGYYDEEDEYPNFTEHIEGDYYEDENDDYYENDIILSQANIKQVQNMKILPQYSQLTNILNLPESNKNLNTNTINLNDSDIDEIYLMPEGSKENDFIACGYDNKKYLSEQQIYIEDCQKIKNNNSYNQLENIKLNLQLNNIDNTNDDILTIYKICSQDNVDIQTNQDELFNINSNKNLIYEQNESINDTIQTYFKNSLPKIITEQNLNNIDSIELISNSSETLKTYSSLSEYGIDTVRNLNPDSCSISKLSLSIKSEIFDDFILTPDEIKLIKLDKDIEDFTLTPEESSCEHSIIKNNNIKDDDSIKEYQNQVVDKFLAKEKNLLENINYTNELSKRRNILTKYENIENNLKINENINIECNTNKNLTKSPNNIRKFSSRYSMQQLEPFNFGDKIIIQTNLKKEQSESLDIKSGTTNRIKSLTNRYKKPRSNSLGNLNKKTKCFPF